MVYLNPLSRLREIRNQECHHERCIEALQPERDQLIRKAMADPHRYSQRTVAMAAGCSRSLIQQKVASDY